MTDNKGLRIEINHDKKFVQVRSARYEGKKYYFTNEEQQYEAQQKAMRQLQNIRLSKFQKYAFS